MEKDRAPVPARQQRQLLGDVRALIDAAKKTVSRTVNTGLVSLYWSIGKRIDQDILQNKRADYGKEIFQTLSGKLVAQYGRGFEKSNLFNMHRLAHRFPDPAIVATLSPQLGWSHFVELLPVADPLKRDYYAEMCRIERWSVRKLRRKIGSMLYERTALSKKPAELAAVELKKLREDDRLTPDMVFRDPYFLDFLNLKGAFQEKDLEAALLREMESFVLELGEGFALRWLDKHDRGPGEEAPIGLILCAGKSGEEVELLQLDQSGIRVAEYMTELPPRRLLEKKLHEALRLARERFKALPAPE